MVVSGGISAIHYSSLLYPLVILFLMNITFVLPMFLDSPAGGFKVVYEYANRLSRRGHRVTVVHPRNLDPQRGLLEGVKSRLWAPKLRWRHGRIPPWFELDRDVAVRLTPDLRQRFIPDGEVIVATAIGTAFAVAGYGASKGRGYYLIQSYETWQAGEERVRASWRLPLPKVVVSRWLADLAREVGEESRTTHIPLGIDCEHFRINRPVRARRRPRVGMLAHPMAIKGTVDGVLALEIARKSCAEIEAILFGTHPRDESLPEWIEYKQRPSPAELVALYNSCQIFLHPSHLEGWGLPAAEAMACGCALVAAHNRGVDEFAVDGDNGLLVPIGAPKLLAEAMLRLLRDDDLRCQLAERGRQHIESFGWDRAVDAFERFLTEGGQR